jgi:hypothetical protein
MDKIIQYLRLLERLNRQSLEYIRALQAELEFQRFVNNMQFLLIGVLAIIFLSLCFFDELFFISEKINKIWKKKN